MALRIYNKVVCVQTVNEERALLLAVLKQENLTLMPGKPQHEAVHGSLQAYGIMSKIGTGQSSAWLIKVNILIFFFSYYVCICVFCVQLQLKYIHSICAGYDAASFFWL